METILIETEFGSVQQKVNHGHVVHASHNCIDAFSDAPDYEDWLNCPCCGLRPKIWTFNNGRQTACGCWTSKYDHFSVMAESIMSHVNRNNGSANGYDCDELRKNWNEYCKTCENNHDHSSLRLLGRW